MSSLTPKYFEVFKPFFDEFNYLSFELNNFAGTDQILNKFNLLHKKFKKQNRADAISPSHKM